MKIFSLIDFDLRNTQFWSKKQHANLGKARQVQIEKKGKK